MKNIVLFTPYFVPYISGITIYNQSLVKHLRKKHNVEVLTFTKVSKENSVLSLPYLFKISKGFVSPQSLLFFWRAARKSDAVIVSVPNFEGLALVLFAKVLGKPITAMYYCNVTLGSDIFSRILVAFLNLSVRLQLMLATKVITMTGYTDFLIPHSKKFAECMPPIRKLASDSTFKNTLLKQKANERWIGFAGRISREKSIENLISALKYAKTKRLRVVFAGPSGKDVAGEDAYFQHVKALIKENNIASTFLGKLTDHQLGSFFEAIDVLVLPSTNSTEAFGMVQAEAMLKGTPSIAHTMAGVTVPITLTGMGKIVDVKNHIAFAKALDEVLVNQKSFSSSAMKKKAQEYFSSQEALKNIEDAISLE